MTNCSNLSLSFGHETLDFVEGFLCVCDVYGYPEQLVYVADDWNAGLAELLADFSDFVTVDYGRGNGLQNEIICNNVKILKRVLRQNVL